MTVLIVDDQINVVSGLMHGIDWKKTGITKVLKAYSAFEAKEQFRSNEIDIVLCDIEMPGEDGLSLCDWSRKNGYRAKYIFLTSHADFDYAKEAIRLGGFDYVLQPVRYEEVESIILRAKENIYSAKKMEEMENCRDLYQRQREVILDGVFRSWILDPLADWAQIQTRLNDLGVEIRWEKPLWLCLLHLFEKSNILKDWENSLIVYSMSNILQELLNPYAYRCMCCHTDNGNYAVCLYAAENGEIGEDSLRKQLERLRELFLEYYNQEFACYVGRSDSSENLADAYDALVERNRENVNFVGGVFWPGEKIRYELKDAQLSRMDTDWQYLLKNRLYDSFAESARAQIARMCENEKLDAEALNRFYQELMRVVHLAANEIGVTVNEMFPDRKTLEDASSAYTSVQKMNWLIDYLQAFFNEAGASEETKKSQVDFILQYIRTHLDQNIRRTDIAEAVHLNPNYVSRLFRSTTGLSLKEYILQEKMNLAAHFLRETNLPISVIAMKVGYTNFSLFSETYKKTFGGITPTEDRKKHRSEGGVSVLMRRGGKTKKFPVFLLGAMSALFVALGGCGTKTEENDIENMETESEAEITTIYIYTPNQASEEACERVAAEIDKITVPLIQCRVKLVGNVTSEQINMALVSEEELDLFPCLTDEFVLADMAEAKQIEPLDALLQKAGSEMLEAISEGDWECVTINGHIYGVPLNREKAQGKGFLMVKEIADELGIDYTKQMNYAQLEAALRKVKEAYPEMYPVVSDQGSMLFPMWEADILGDGLGGLENCLSGDTTVVNLYESDSFFAYCSLLYQWGKEGLMMPDAINTVESGSDLIESGIGWGTFSPFWEGIEEIESERIGKEMAIIQLTEPYSTTETTGSCWVISSKSENAEKAMQVLNLMYTNPKIANLLMNGTEGENWVFAKEEEGVIKRPEETDALTDDYSVCGRIWPNEQITYTWEGYGQDYWERLNEFNLSVRYSSARGFIWNPKNVRNEVNACKLIVDKYLDGLITGCLNPTEAIPRMNEELKEAGIDLIIEEKQSQLDRYLAQ